MICECNPSLSVVLIVYFSEFFLDSVNEFHGKSIVHGYGTN
jgi:hypothetical protein